MKIAVIGTGYVGLVTGVCLAEIGHQVTCVDVDHKKIAMMTDGYSPIFEPDLEKLMKRNLLDGRLHFTTAHQEALATVDVIYIAVGTPQRSDGTSDLQYIQQAARHIGTSLQQDSIVVTKSTVPVGTNELIQKWIEQTLRSNNKVEVVSNPEFLREGSAVHDTFHGDRIVIGSENKTAAAVLEDINQPFGIPIYHTDRKSAELIKYASNAFLATKISFINEISAICEKVGANVDDVAFGMGKDKRIGDQFLQAGIGYGGSCFPKDTNALVQIAGNNQHNFQLLKSVIEVNNTQQNKLIQKAKEVVGPLQGKKVALLGLAFKPNTDDMREAASIPIARSLVEEGAEVLAYDPIAISNAKGHLPKEVIFKESLIEVLTGADVALIITEWKEIKELDLNVYVKRMNSPIVIDGRNCYSLEDAANYSLNYISIGRPTINQLQVSSTV
ncbi:UDP-glucose/GDP-mannose dehydrogenase family protein [Anaerobacillus sp. 1_MG-2023]|uniref:UDP-glucose dehydrogenase family protein n=1 Tax=Anaerobacillus sp. 1_MG-2023 TaxID=3062655 RepID=UPI0026E35A3F|nr:UDP-glucose/GDP-mannose dehydrogenase family protein [Anaerobacillus sp. 1_MG-2023]MDO6657238.1 UDP-glucose/GDP-mannose dehydrogenase family protein [Anaerobacillus sp. 1_MG-2023]